jgi:hypothetical protein
MHYVIHSAMSHPSLRSTQNQPILGEGGRSAMSCVCRGPESYLSKILALALSNLDFANEFLPTQ